MRSRSLAAIAVLLSSLVAIACADAGNACLNPQPDLPSCRASGGPPYASGGSQTSGPGALAGSGNGVPSSGGASGSSAAGPEIDPGTSNGEAGASGEGEGAAAGAGGDSGVDVPEGGAGGAVDTAGAGGAGSSDIGP